MPHIIIEYSANIESEVTPQRMVDEVHAAAVASGIAEIPGYRTRAERRDAYRVGDGDPRNAFVHVLARLRDGRSIEERRAVAEMLLAAANRVLEPVFAVRPLSLSVEVQEIDSRTRVMRNGLRARAAA